MKKFLTKISYTVLPVWLLLVGMVVYLWATNDNSGDLMRLGLIDGGPEYTDSIMGTDVLQDVLYESQNNDSLLRLDTCDVVVIGDSFSHGGGVGKQGDFVNYLAHDSGRRVVVFTPGDNPQASPVQMAFDALNLGVIDSTNVRNLVVRWSVTLWDVTVNLPTTTLPCLVHKRPRSLLPLIMRLKMSAPCCVSRIISSITCLARTPSTPHGCHGRCSVARNLICSISIMMT